MSFRHEFHKWARREAWAWSAKPGLAAVSGFSGLFLVGMASALAAWLPLTLMSELPATATRGIAAVLATWTVWTAAVAVVFIAAELVLRRARRAEGIP